MAILLLLTVVLLCGAALAWFVHLEKAGRPLTVLIAIAVVLIVESTLYYSANLVSVGLFHPEIGGLSFRLFDLLIPCAVLARLLSGRAPRLQPAVLWWGPFTAWLAGAAVLGATRGNDLQYLTFEAKLLIYLAVVPLAAGVPAVAWSRSAGVRRLVTASAVLAVVLTATHLLGIAIALPLPMMPIETLGTFGSDLASIFVAMGIVALALSLCLEHGRTRWVLVALPLLACPLAVGQRAALLALTVSLIALVVLAPVGRRQLRTTPTEVAVFLAMGLALVAVPAAAPAVSEARPGEVPFSSIVSDAFTSRGKQLSQQDRVNQWMKARTLIAERPLFGWGLGTSYSYWDPGFYRFKEINLTHNIATDLLLRTGGVGLLLFLVAVGVTLAVGVRAWQVARDPRVAALALGAASAAAGLLAKGMVESIFEKYRLALFLAALFGIMIAMARDADATVTGPYGRGAVR